MNVVIADDHRMIRDGIKSLLIKFPDVHVVGEAENSNQLFTLLEQVYPEIILLDVTMPGKSGLELFPELKRNHPNIKIVFLTMHEEPEYIIKAVKAGAHGYLLKNTDAEELYKALIKIKKGERYFNESVSKILMENLHLSTEEQEIESKLTDRELEVLQEISNGLTTKQIGEKLFISHRTVETHRVNLMKKMEVNNVAELVKKAIDLKLLN